MQIRIGSRLEVDHTPTLNHVFTEARGHRLDYQWLGEKSNVTPLVFLHEGLGSIGLWRDYPRDVAEGSGHPALVYSRYGHGRSDRLREPRTPHFMHDEALQVLPGLVDVLVGGPPILIGHSDGASIALIYAGSGYPVKGMVLIAVDLPGHERSVLEKRFTFARAAHAIERSIDHAGLGSAILVGHSMGGPTALTAIRQSVTNRFAGLVAIATSAYWVRPRHRIMVASAPYLFAPRSPIVTGAMRAETRSRPGHAAQVAADYAMRPRRRVLAESAAELMRFDARDWSDLRIPPAIWIVTAEDSVVPPADQRASANHFGIDTVEITSDHPALTRVPSEVCAIIENSFRTPRL